MRIVMQTTKGELAEIIAQTQKLAREKLLRMLHYAGEKAVNEARSTAKQNDWTDRTGNLRSSIGYGISENGAILEQSEFNEVLSTATDGRVAGEALLRKVAAETPGLALIVVAGMNYASYVADKGYNVLSSSQILTQSTIKQLFKQVK